MIRWKLKDLTGKIFKEQDGKFEVGLSIPMLIGIMITIVVGINLIGPITSTVDTIKTAVVTTTVQGTTTTTPAYSSTVQGLTGLFPIVIIVFVTVIILGAVAFMGFHTGEDKEEKTEKSITVTIKTNSQKVISLVMKASNELEPYVNNLDELLGIKTFVQGFDGLSLIGNNLYIPKGTEQGGEYDWYITAKQKDADVFKVVGLNKTDSSKNVVYALGNNGTPFLIKVETKKTESEIAHPTLVEHFKM
jgi:hypothetical protein